eukprot:EG_transcript_22754
MRQRDERTPPAVVALHGDPYGMSLNSQRKEHVEGEVHLSGDVLIPGAVLAVGVLLTCLIAKLQQYGSRSSLEAQEHREMEALMMAAATGEIEEDGQRSFAFPKDLPVPAFSCQWPRILSFSATPFIMGLCAMLVQLIFHVPVLGSAFHLDLEVSKLALLWAIPWISISILPVEKIPGLEILQEIHQVGKFINMILLGLEKSLRTLPQIV